MGRAKLRLERLEPGASRNTTYTKRRHGLTKKVSELSILCDIDIMLLTFSPGGRPAFFKSENSSIEEIIGKFAQLTPQERAQRKLESLEVLKKAFKNPEHVINLTDPFGPDYHSAEDLIALAELLRARLSDLKLNLSCWTYMDEIESIEQLVHMKESLGKSLYGIWNCKDQIQRQHLGLQCADQQNFEEQLDMQYADQFHQGVNFPFNLEEQLQLLSWIDHHHKQNMELQNNLFLLHHGDTMLSGAIPFEGCPGIRTADQMDLTTGVDHCLPMDIPNAGYENGSCIDLINRGHADYSLLNAGNSEHGFPMDDSKTEYDDDYLLDFFDSGHGRAIFMDLIEPENHSGQECVTGHRYDISREPNRTENKNSLSADMIRTPNENDTFRDLMNNHHECKTRTDFSQGSSEHISMDLVNFANDYGISMGLVKSEHMDGFPFGTGDSYGTSVDLEKVGCGTGLPIDMTRPGRRQCFQMSHTEARNDLGISMDMLKGAHDFYITRKSERKRNRDMQLDEEDRHQSFKHAHECCITDKGEKSGNLDSQMYEKHPDQPFKHGHDHYHINKTERKENLDMQVYEEQPDQSYTFPLVFHNTFQPQEHIEMQENAFASSVDKIFEVHEFGVNPSDQTSVVDPLDEYLHPQLYNSSDDNPENYNDHLYFGPTGCPLIVH